MPCVRMNQYAMTQIRNDENTGNNRAALTKIGYRKKNLTVYISTSSIFSLRFSRFVYLRKTLRFKPRRNQKTPASALVNRNKSRTEEDSQKSEIAN